MKRYQVQALFAITITVLKEALLQTQPDGVMYCMCLFAKHRNKGQKVRLNPNSRGWRFRCGARWELQVRLIEVQSHLRGATVGGEPSPIGEGYLKRPPLMGGPESTVLSYAWNYFAGGRTQRRPTIEVLDGWVEPRTKQTSSEGYLLWASPWSLTEGSHVVPRHASAFHWIPWPHTLLAG
jgi:hypothetical protein